MMDKKEGGQDQPLESSGESADANGLCGKCGAPLEAKASFCIKCGAEVPARPLNFQGLPEWWKKAAVGLLGLTVLGVLISAFWPSGTPGVSEEEPRAETKVSESQPARAPLPHMPVRRPKRAKQKQEPSATGDWKVRTAVSPLDDVTTVTLDLRAEDTQETRGRSAFASQLSFLCTADHIEGYVFVRVPPESAQSARATVRMRFDGLDAETATMERSANDDALFFGQPAKMLKRMLGHERMLFGYTPRDSGEAVSDFDLRGLGEAIKPLAEGCGLPELAAAVDEHVAPGSESVAR